MAGFFLSFGLLKTTRPARGRLRPTPKPKPTPTPKSTPNPRARSTPLPAIKPRGGLSRVATFGTNPGALGMMLYTPPGLRAGRPLVVVLHGCGQTAGGFAEAAGWIALAREFRFSLVLPEQTAVNNRGRCFNWFNAGDIRADGGEALSIRQMVRTAVKLTNPDRKQIFVVGFSAGGGMAAALLAAFPALFAAGAVVAGMAVGSASTPIGALMRMHRADAFRSREGLARSAMRASGVDGRKRWPRISIWQGDEDQTVDPANAEALAAQWGELHGYDAVPSEDDLLPAARRRRWGRAGRPAAVELWTLPRLGHAFPIDRAARPAARRAPWITDAGVSAPHQIAAFWNLTR